MQRTQISLTDEDRELLDAESERTGRSISALIRDAVQQTYRRTRDLDADLKAIAAAAGAWKDRDVDGEEYVEQIRNGTRLRDAFER
ncbi:MAG: ribbon-helix-helix protein, CopG family [Gordonia sp. (in: high G+C Gram-positive bacteria)]|uniref:ribbon-helix-helix protein, CopG family n=1 Tax=Gordonia sp. (in: high G+C Gram-positive bacteria) TaxID=84139 RepID=UPI0039E2B736